MDARCHLDGWFLRLRILGGTPHLTARDSADDEIPKPNWIELGIAVAIGVLIGNLTKRCPPYEDDPPPGD